jgi:hypothetical protein
MGGVTDEIKKVGGLAAVVAGVAGVATIAIVAIAVGGETAATVAGSTAAVIGSMVGAFFGVKIGTDQTKNAIEAQREEAAKAQVYAAHLRPEDAGVVIDKARKAATDISTGEFTR